MIKPEDIKRFEGILKKIQGKDKQAKYQYMALCPAHGDARLSLWVKLQDTGKISLACKAGCAESEVCDALGIKIADLYSADQIIAVFDYINLDAELLYQEVKYDTNSLKRFRVRRPGKKKGEWIKEIKGIGLILYNLYDVAQTKEGDTIFLCEGAKDACNLKYKGLIATATLWNAWDKADTSPLDHRHVVIMQDNDAGGETKALLAAHDRYNKSSSVKILLLPGLGKGGDVTDWLEAGGTVENLIVLAEKTNEWFPLASIRQQIKDRKLTGLSFEHYDPRPAFEAWYETYHPPEEGLLYLYDDEYLKGNLSTLLYEQISKSPEIINSMFEFFELCHNAKSKKGEDLFKPTPALIDMILNAGNSKIDLNVLKNPAMPIFNPFFTETKLDDYDTNDIILLKSNNFYIPNRTCFPRNMEQCIARTALPFDYDEKAKCPEIEKTFEIQWGNYPNESTAMLLQFLYYYMLHTFKYKAILNLIGESDSGKSLLLDLIRYFIGFKNCAALSLSKIGKQFELYPARHCKLLISDEMSLTKRDLQEGAIVENIKSIASGAIIRMEKKGGEIIYRQFSGQMLLAGNNPLTIQEFSNALSNRFYFLNFPHVFIQGEDMDTNILSTWLPELSGLLNLALDAGPKLIEQDGFIEPKASAKIRDKFEGGGNPIKRFVEEYFDVNAVDDKTKWNMCIGDAKKYYENYCEEEGINQLPLFKFNAALESVQGVSRGATNIKFINSKTNKVTYKTIKCWVGIRRKGTSGVITNENVMKNDEF